MVGDPEDLKPGERFNYPIFKGFYSGVRWLQYDTAEGPITAVVGPSARCPNLHAETPPPDLLGQVTVPFPNAGVSFLHAAPLLATSSEAHNPWGPWDRRP